MLLYIMNKLGIETRGIAVEKISDVLDLFTGCVIVYGFSLLIRD